MTVIRHLLSSGAKVNQAREVVSSFLYHIRDILGAHTASRMPSQVHVLCTTCSLKIYNVVLFQEDNIFIITWIIYVLQYVMTAALIFLSFGCTINER